MNKSAPLEIESTSGLKTSTLEPFFSPQGVAVIGASPKPGNLGKRIVHSLKAQGYSGSITVVHPKGLTVNSCLSVTRIEDLPDETDLAIAAVSAASVLSLVEPLGKQGIHHLIVVGGGFSETGREGKQIQNKLADLGNRYEVRILGPNCMGTFSAPDKFNSFFLAPEDIALPAPGSAAIISQSGAFMSMILDHLAHRSVGVHRAINFGNRVDIGECEALEMFASDPNVKVIGLYLESVQNGRKFFDIARKVSQRKPIVIYKGGKGEKGNRATMAHSASLAGSYSVFQTLCRQTGMIEVQGLNELVNALQALSLSAIPSGNRVLIVSNGGGMGVLLTDLCEKGSCNLIETPLEIQKELKKIFPNYYSFKNPIDLTGSGTNRQCALVIEKILQKEIYDCLLLVVLPGAEGITADIVRHLRGILPMDLTIIMGAYGRNLCSQLQAALAKEEIPVFSTGEEAAWAMSLLVQIGSQSSELKKEMAKINNKYSSLPLRGWLGGLSQVPDEMQLKHLMGECGIQVPKSLPVITKEDLEKAIKEIGFPMVLKVVNKNILHKTEMKGVQLDLFEEYELQSRWRQMNKTWPGQIWAEEQMSPGLDLMVGMNRDPNFGPILIFGTGGRYVEIYNDIERILLPATDEEILQAIFRTHAGKIIKGVRGDQALDFSKLVGFIKFVSGWVENETALLSLDFNPIRLYQNSLFVLDAKAKINISR